MSPAVALLGPPNNASDLKGARAWRLVAEELGRVDSDLMPSYEDQRINA
jgi:hypothetical protein